MGRHEHHAAQRGQKTARTRRGHAHDVKDQSGLRSGRYELKHTAKFQRNLPPSRSSSACMTKTPQGGGLRGRWKCQQSLLRRGRPLTFQIIKVSTQNKDQQLMVGSTVEVFTVLPRTRFSSLWQWRSSWFSTQDRFQQRFPQCIALQLPRPILRMSRLNGVLELFPGPKKVRPHSRVRSQVRTRAHPRWALFKWLPLVLEPLGLTATMTRGRW